MVEQADLVRKRDKEEEMGEERAGPGGGEGKMEKKNTRIDKNLEEPAFDLPLPLPRPLPLLASFCPPPLRLWLGPLFWIATHSKNINEITPVSSTKVSSRQKEGESERDWAREREKRERECVLRERERESVCVFERERESNGQQQCWFIILDTYELISSKRGCRVSTMAVIGRDVETERKAVGRNRRPLSAWLPKWLRGSVRASHLAVTGSFKSRVH